MNAEIMRNQYRVHSSLMNVNRRLEVEILKLKANLNERSLRLEKLENKHKEQAMEMQKLLEHIKNNASSNNDNISKSFGIEVT